jgi:general secretion pathway protein I
VTVPRRGERGFTLLEVIVAMALLAAGIVAISRLFIGSLRLSGGARDASAAAIYARQRMEEALLAPDPAEGVEQGAFGDRYRWILETSFVPPEEEKPYDEIRVLVTVSWTDGPDERAVDLSANRWMWKEKDEEGLPVGRGRSPLAFGAGGGGMPVAGGGGIPGAGGGRIPGVGGGRVDATGSGGEQGDSFGGPVGRRLP